MVCAFNLSSLHIATFLAWNLFCCLRNDSEGRKTLSWFLWSATL
jgi:hypothetical protein